MKKSFFLSLLVHGILITVLMALTFGPEPQKRNIPIKLGMFILPNEPIGSPLPPETVPAISATAHKEMAEPVMPKMAETQTPKDEAETAKTQVGAEIARQEAQAEAARKREEAEKARKTAEVEEARKRAEAEAAMAAENARLEGLRESYISSLRSEIERNKKYPVLSRAKGEEGKTVLVFRVLKNGQIVNARMITSSAFEKLDEAALKALEKVGVFRHIPSELQEDFMDITVPVSFKSQEMRG